METDDDDQQSQENIQEQGTSEAAATNLQVIRSYDCTFCKRGFSNAQALGGHMNIHRKHKATLNQAAAAASSNINYQNQQSFNISVRPSTEVMGSTAATATQPGEVRKLPLFVEGSPPLKIDQRAASSSPQKDLEEEDLDLELRLGPEPHQESSTSATVAEKLILEQR